MTISTDALLEGTPGDRKWLPEATASRVTLLSFDLGPLVCQGQSVDSQF